MPRVWHHVRLDDATDGDETEECAIDVFVRLAKAQPFEDGNRRTALFVANALLLGAGADTLLTVPFDEHDPGVADTFNDLLARAYVRGEHEGMVALLRDRGLVTP